MCYFWRLPVFRQNLPIFYQETRNLKKSRSRFCFVSGYQVIFKDINLILKIVIKFKKHTTKKNLGFKLPAWHMSDQLNLVERDYCQNEKYFKVGRILLIDRTKTLARTTLYQRRGVFFSLFYLLQEGGKTSSPSRNV